MYDEENKNIVAIATPPGKSALALIRISGKNLTSIFKTLTHKHPKDRYALFSKIYSPKSKSILDEAVITYFRSPNSFTGEDIIEISCHGGSAVKQSIIKACLDLNIHNAGPGEFSYRAFMNGKIDLLQAEAISSLIDSKSTKSTEQSLMHLDGKVSKNLIRIKSEIIDVLSIIENELNFSEEEIDHTSTESILKIIKDISFQIDNIITTSIMGKKLFSGIRVVILGPPNVGKSSLFNTILGEDRAITSPEAGTTRDTVESWFELEGLPVCLIDTAGIWESPNTLDLLGIEKTISELNKSDICLLVDTDDPNKLLKSKFIKKDDNKLYILIKSKADLHSSKQSSDESVVYLSSINNVGIKELLTTISTYIVDNLKNSEVTNIMITQRQMHLLETSSTYINTAIEQININLETDIIASTLHGFVNVIKEVIGDIPNKDIINNIFNNFCVGK